MSAQAPAVALSLAAENVAILTLDQPAARVNLLNSGVLAELARHFDELSGRSDLAGLVIRSGKPGVFIAGADIKELAAAMNNAGPPATELCHRGRRLFAQLSRMPFVTVSAISGVCLGGGAELSLWCDRRILTTDPRTEFALPEVKIGVIPGWGGTARAPRIIGLSNAIELICTGEGVDARRAFQLGLCSDFVPEDQLLDAAVCLIQAEQQSGEWRRDRQRWAGPVEMSDEELAFLEASARGYLHQQTKGQYPAPMAALEVMVRGSRLSAEAAGELEAETFGAVAAQPAARSLIHVFFL
ncbi:MAG: enoyl-CoA hydratase/isomerase family protein, partial [Phycisphaerae bacterium]